MILAVNGVLLEVFKRVMPSIPYTTSCRIPGRQDKPDAKPSARKWILPPLSDVGMLFVSFLIEATKEIDGVEFSRPPNLLGIHSLCLRE